jgi:predicted nuclease with TOPRIM domain
MVNNFGQELAKKQAVESEDRQAKLKALQDEVEKLRKEKEELEKELKEKDVMGIKNASVSDKTEPES